MVILLQVFEGDLVDEARHGAGEYRYADGTVYSGEWHRGQRQGFGTLVSSSGAIYEGVFFDAPATYSHERITRNVLRKCSFGLICFERGWDRKGRLLLLTGTFEAERAAPFQCSRA